MFDYLPHHIQAQLIRLLQANQFQAAKRLYDQWARVEVGG